MVKKIARIEHPVKVLAYCRYNFSRRICMLYGRTINLVDFTRFAQSLQI
jgi:hypothetical protein